MGTIIARKRNDGTTGYMAQIRVKQKGAVIHTETYYSHYARITGLLLIGGSPPTAAPPPSAAPSPTAAP